MLLQGNLLGVGLPAIFAHESRHSVALVLRMPVKIGFVLVRLVALHAFEFLVQS